VRIRQLTLTLLAAAAVLMIPCSVTAQQRPLTTEDPEAIGAGRILIEAGLDIAHNQEYPVSGLEGNLLRVPTLGVSFGISSIAEVQIDGGLFNRLSIKHRNPAPLAALVTATGDRTHDIEDLVVATKIRLKAEAAGSPSFGLRFATRLPNATNESGLGVDTTDFSAALLGAKTVQSIRVVGNIGFAILSDPTDGQRQNDVLTYGVSLARATTDHAELVGEINGRLSIRSGEASPGTESRGTLTLGGRYTRGSYRLDAAFFLGLTPVDPTVGFTTGFTYVFTAFEVP
jgi:hypothetical protein